MKLFSYVLLGLLVAGCQTVSAESQTTNQQQDTFEIILFRHAEKQDDGTRDPALSEQGMQRVESLTEWLHSKELDGIYSTDYRRTRDTATPIAEDHNMEVTLYDPRAPQSLIEDLLTKRGNAVIVGHSNTTPGLVALLGGDPQGGIQEPEYDVLYVLTIDQDGQVETRKLNQQTDL